MILAPGAGAVRPHQRFGIDDHGLSSRDRAGWIVSLAYNPRGSEVSGVWALIGGGFWRFRSLAGFPDALGECSAYGVGGELGRARAEGSYFIAVEPPCLCG